MASVQEIISLAKSISRLAVLTREFRNELRRVLDYNTAQGIDWANVHTTLGISDADTDIDVSAESGADDMPYSPNQVSNALFSLSQFAAVWDNTALTQGDHGGNLQQLTNANKYNLLLSESKN